MSNLFHCANAPLRIESTTTSCEADVVTAVAAELDTSRGVVLTSRYEYPGRYTRWDIATVNPPIAIEAVSQAITITALNERGEILIPVFEQIIQACKHVDVVSVSEYTIHVQVHDVQGNFLEEDRSKNPHVLNAVRHIRESLSIDDSSLGFYGIFGYDLGIDFMGVNKTQMRDGDRDMVLYFADRLYVTDHTNQESYIIEYEFDVMDGDYVTTSTRTIEREGCRQEYVPVDVEPTRDIPQGGYADIVKKAKEYFARGDLFEVVPSQSFHEPCFASPSTIFNELLDVNPAPYGALINLGHSEWTISASPEMFVRVEGSRVESCPISGTIARGSDGITDAEQIEKLLSSEKDASELTMCTDVDRNDKSRVCAPGSVKVIGRRQIEMYSRLIHTVDHVEGKLLDGLDSIDAFLTHTWAVTVTGAPKLWAMRFIEEHEASPRRFYGGAMGLIALDGTMNTGLMLRSIHLHSGQAHIRVGATLLADSIDIEEERETELKASAMLDVVRYCHGRAQGQDPPRVVSHAGIVNNIHTADREKSEEIMAQDQMGDGSGPSVLLIDCEDSFVHTLAGYFRMARASVHTRRIGFSRDELATDIAELSPDIVCLSPGPGSPTDFGLNDVIDVARSNNLPIFGVCLGLQALVEYFGGTLGQLDVPMHGKVSRIDVTDNSSKLFAGINSSFDAGRYHSLFAVEDTFPVKDLKVTARTHDDGVIMAIEHVSEPIAAVQFHPESIMTLEDGVGLAIVSNAIRLAKQ